MYNGAHVQSIAEYFHNKKNSTSTDYSRSHTLALFLELISYTHAILHLLLLPKIYTFNTIYIAEILLQIYRSHKINQYFYEEPLSRACILWHAYFFLFEAVMLNKLLECSNVFRAFYYIFFYQYALMDENINDCFGALIKQKLLPLRFIHSRY